MKNFNLGLVALLFSTAVNAVPQKYNNCSVAKDIQSPGTAQGFFLNKSCDKVYVLPPVEGAIEVAGYIPTYSSADCDNLEKIEGQISSTRERIAVLEEEFDAGLMQNADYRATRRHCGELKAAFLRKDLEVQSFQEDLENKKQELEEAKILVGDCEGAQGLQVVTCSMLKVKVETLPIEIFSLDSKISSELKRRTRAERKHKNCENELAIQREIITAEGSEVQDQIIAEEAKMAVKLAQYRSYRTEIQNEAGGSVGVQLFSRQEELRQSYQDLNSGLGLEFVNMPINKGLLSLEFVIDGEEANTPVLLRSRINGLVDNGQLPLALEELSSTRIAVNSIIGQAIAGEMEINSFGACKIRQRANATGQNELEVLAALITPSAHFSYPTQVKRILDIKYEEKHLYQLIKKQTNKKSGLFKSKSVSSVTEKSNADKWIQVEISSEDENHEFVDSQKMLADIRSEFADAALMRVARSYTTAPPLPLSAPGPNAASQASAVLKKCPNFYCQVASFGLDLGNALFGGSTSESNMKRIVEASDSQRYVDSKMVPGFATQVYKYREAQ